MLDTDPRIPDVMVGVPPMMLLLPPPPPPEEYEESEVRLSLAADAIIFAVSAAATAANAAASSLSRLLLPFSCANAVAANSASSALCLVICDARSFSLSMEINCSSVASGKMERSSLIRWDSGRIDVVVVLEE